MRVTLIISALSAGGAERVMSTMANYWAASDWQVTLITLDSETADFYALHPRVRRVGLGLMAPSGGRPWAALRNNLLRLSRLRWAIRESRPEVAISFIHRMNVLTLLAIFGLGVPLIVSERIDPREHRIGLGWSALRRLLYPKARAVVVQSNAVRRWAEAIARRDKIYVIPNPVASSTASPEGDVSPPLPNPRVVAVGRLNPQKGFDLLLRAFERCAVEHPDWSLVILGEGEERERLTGLATELGIAKRVWMPGVVREPAVVLREADIFVLSSRYEGFPNALLEAMACAVPVVSFDCPSGPAEVVRDGVDGMLVPPEDVDALSVVLKRLMSDEGERRRLALRAPEVLQRFGVETVMETWGAVINKVTR